LTLDIFKIFGGKLLTNDIVYDIVGVFQIQLLGGGIMGKDIIPFEECIKYDTCSSNRCPLDPDIELRQHVKDEEKCTARKRGRYKIGVKYPQLLKNKGLTAKEHKGYELSGVDPSTRLGN